MRGHLRFTSASLAAVALVLGACSDDDPATAGATTTEAGGDATTSTTEGGEEATSTTAAAGGELDELCALAEEMFNQDDFPSVEQLTQYQELAPDEIADAVQAAAGPIIAADGDPVASLVAFAEDDVEVAIEVIDAFEVENCGIEHDPPPSEEQSTVDPAATRVDVVATEYDFDLPAEVAAGSTSFVLTNGGEEAHFMFIAQIVEGHTLEEALAYEGDPEEAGIVTDFGPESGLAAPGGEDEEVITVDLPAGNFAMLCFLPGPDGTPHAFTGMAVPFTAS